MSADLTNFIPPYRPSHPASISPSEFIALRTIVMSLVAIMAGESERVGGHTAQTFINNLAISCSDVVNRADITGPASEGIRSGALEHINRQRSFPRATQQYELIGELLHPSELKKEYVRS